MNYIDKFISIMGILDDDDIEKRAWWSIAQLSRVEARSKNSALSSLNWQVVYLASLCNIPEDFQSMTKLFALVFVDTVFEITTEKNQSKINFHSIWLMWVDKQKMLRLKLSACCVMLMKFS